ncbi:hypothetical protein [Sphingomonas sp. LT1P40]|uniref:hypothetical protein n=1 Tax=Alteristakelama amylovorans TaxID=3096166 RepID=UPI002FCB3B19
MKLFASAAALVLLAGCTAGNTPPPGRAAPIPVPQGMSALTGVLGQNSAGLVAQFGKPTLDISEGSARKLQFTGPICVLDAYLYPPKSGRGDSTVTFAETRQRDGSPIDQSSCAAALRASRAGK